jgi:mono/diheme cytochrome c family protein
MLVEAWSRVDFARQVKPLLERSCVGCHSGERPKGGFRVESRDSLFKSGPNGEPPIVPGRSDKSPLLRFVADQVEDLEMPPVAKRDKYPSFSQEEIAVLRTWIEQWVVWPDVEKLRPPAASQL